jgi:hypothetical protein
MLRQEDHEFKTSLGYIERPCLKKKKKKKPNKDYIIAISVCEVVYDIHTMTKSPKDAVPACVPVVKCSLNMTVGHNCVDL